MMGSLEDLQAAVLTRGPIDGDHAACQHWIEATVVVPVAVVLMPLPGAAGARLLQDHLVVIVVHLAAEQRFHGIDNSPAADECTVDVILQFIVDAELYGSALPVPPAGGLPV